MADDAPLGPEAETNPCGEGANLGALERALGRAFGRIVGRAESGLPIQELPMQQVRCLYVLNRLEGAAMKDIAARLQVDLPALSRLVDRLARRDLVERRGEPTNRRIVRLFLTERGREMLRSTHAAREAHLRRCTQRIDAEVLEELTRLLQLLADEADMAVSLHGAESGALDYRMETLAADEHARDA